MEKTNCNIYKSIDCNKNENRILLQSLFHAILKFMSFLAAYIINPLIEKQY